MPQDCIAIITGNLCIYSCTAIQIKLDGVLIFLPLCIERVGFCSQCVIISSLVNYRTVIYGCPTFKGMAEFCWGFSCDRNDLVYFTGSVSNYSITAIYIVNERCIIRCVVQLQNQTAVSSNVSGLHFTTITCSISITGNICFFNRSYRGVSCACFILCYC